METITYNLKCNQKGSSQFYHELSIFTDIILEEAKEKFILWIHAFESYISTNKIEKTRQQEEYILEILMLGTFWNQYNNRIHLGTRWSFHILKFLYHIRMTHQRIKPFIDRFRGWLMALILDRKGAQKKLNVRNLGLLLEWMDCTNEFNDEVRRLQNWYNYLKQLNDRDVLQILEGITIYARQFENKCKRTFSNYTQQVYAFLSKKHGTYRYRENYFFTGRTEVEYHLNMVGAEILNRVLRAGFKNTKYKTVLLPTCMCAGRPCKAIKDGTDITCVHCTKTCKVSDLTLELKKQGINTVLIPHSSKFSKWLHPYADQQETGLVGVACVLNLLKGGYEMTNLNIPSQCVFLDHCGCKKHWHHKGVITDLDSNQLLNHIFSPVSRNDKVLTH